MGVAISSIILFFAVIYFLFYAVWGGSLLVGAIGGTISLIVYLIIIFTPLNTYVIRASHHREPNKSKLLNAYLVAVTVLKGVIKITAHIAFLFLLICRLIVSFAVLLATHNWHGVVLTYYLSKWPLKIFSIITSPLDSLVEWVIRHIELE